MSKTGSKPAAKRPVLLPQVEPVEGEPGRFWVQSRSRLNLRHLVDMWEYRGNGACGCEDFERKYRPHLEEGALPSPLLACRHLHAVRAFSAVDFWHRAAMEKEKAEKRWVLESQERQERKRNEHHAAHEDLAEVEATAEGTLDHRPGLRRYQVKSAQPFTPRPVLPGPPAVQGDDATNGGVPKARGNLQAPLAPVPPRGVQPADDGHSPHAWPGWNAPR